MGSSMGRPGTSVCVRPPGVRARVPFAELRSSIVIPVADGMIRTCVRDRDRVWSSIAMGVSAALS